MVKPSVIGGKTWCWTVAWWKLDNKMVMPLTDDVPLHGRMSSDFKRGELFNLRWLRGVLAKMTDDDGLMKW